MDDPNEEDPRDLQRIGPEAEEQTPKRDKKAMLRENRLEDVGPKEVRAYVNDVTLDFS